VLLPLHSFTALAATGEVEMLAAISILQWPQEGLTLLRVRSYVLSFLDWKLLMLPSRLCRTESGQNCKFCPLSVRQSLEA